MPASEADSTARSTAPRPERFAGLDLIRGIAAVTVLVFHVDFMFGLRGELLPGGYLAVDLFFVLSGVVIACNYEPALRGGRITLAGFVARRLARLYPLYLATFAVGLVVMSVRFLSQYGHVAWRDLSITAAANLILLPSFARPYGIESPFPFNATSWSVFFELVINLAFAIRLFRMGTPGLVGVWLLAGFCFAWTVLAYGSADLGWGAGNFVAAIPRVSVSFVAGMLIWRRFEASPWAVDPRLLLLLLGIYCMALQVRLSFTGPWGAAFDTLTVTIVLPVIVIAGLGAQLRGADLWIARLLGDISYSVYLIQASLIIAVAGLFQGVAHGKIANFAPTAGLLFVPLCLVLSWLSFRSFERPAQRGLGSLLRKRAPSPAPSQPPGAGEPAIHGL